VNTTVGHDAGLDAAVGTENTCNNNNNYYNYYSYYYVHTYAQEQQHLMMFETW